MSMELPYDSAKPCLDIYPQGSMSHRRDLFHNSRTWYQSGCPANRENVPVYSTTSQLLNNDENFCLKRGPLQKLALNCVCNWECSWTPSLPASIFQYLNWLPQMPFLATSYLLFGNFYKLYYKVKSLFSERVLRYTHIISTILAFG